MIDPLSVSVTAERLLYRSKAELETGDYSLSIVVAVMAVESYLTRLFLKLKGIDSSLGLRLPTAAEQEKWEEEYPRKGGFSRPADFVSQRLVAKTFDNFVAGNPQASALFSRLRSPSQISPAQYFQKELFNRRNRIAHWGYVNSGLEEAELCHTIAVALVSILREMDRAKYGT